MNFKHRQEVIDTIAHKPMYIVHVMVQIGIAAADVLI
jgi:hypothetical protein